MSTKKVKKRIWWDSPSCKACVFGDKSFVKKLSRLGGRRVIYKRSKTNAIDVTNVIFKSMKNDGK